MPSRIRPCLPFLLFTFVVSNPGDSSAQQLPDTWQEQQDFRSGPTPFEPLMDFWYELDAMSELVSMQPLTETLMGREMNLIVIANDPGGESSRARRVVVASSGPRASLSPSRCSSQVARAPLRVRDSRGAVRRGARVPPRSARSRATRALERGRGPSAFGTPRLDGGTVPQLLALRV